MAFDGIVTKAVVSELNSSLKNAKVNKIMQPTKNEVVFEIYNNGGKYFLKLSIAPNNCRICLTDNLKENPKVPYNFCMVLRKHLNRSKILSFSTYDLERTVEIEFETFDEENGKEKKRLYIEIMNRQSNIILAHENNIIIDVLKRYEEKELIPNKKFIFAPILKTSFLELENFGDFSELICNNSEESLTQKLPEIFIGFSKTFVANLISILNINDKNYSENDLEKLYEYIKEILVKIDTNKVSLIKTENDFTIVLKDKEYPLQINKFIDEYYYKKEQKDAIAQSKNNLLKIISSNLKKVYKKLENINQKIKECDEMDKYRLYGELLTANLYQIDGNKNISEIEVYNYYENKNIIIELDNSITVSKNIERFFKKYNKLKNALNIVSEQKKEAEKEIDYIESIVFSLENVKNLQDIYEIYEEVYSNLNIKKNAKAKTKVKNEKEIKIEPIDIQGFKVYVGKNNIQNEFLSLKFAKNDDLWFHAQKIHGSHVILKTNNEDIPENVIYECARLAKENSKAKNSVNVAVDYCKAKFVKRIPNGKSGMVSYTNFSTIIVK